MVKYNYTEGLDKNITIDFDEHDSNMFNFIFDEGLNNFAVQEKTCIFNTNQLHNFLPCIDYFNPSIRHLFVDEDDKFALSADYFALIKKYKLKHNERFNAYDCETDLICQPDICRDGKLIFKLGLVKGDFDCSNMKLVTLKNCPKVVLGNYKCDNNYLKSLKYAPKFVRKNFTATNNNLITIKYMPKKVCGEFICSDNPELKKVPPTWFYKINL